MELGAPEEFIAKYGKELDFSKALFYNLLFITKLKCEGDYTKYYFAVDNLRIFLSPFVDEKFNNNLTKIKELYEKEQNSIHPFRDGVGENLYLSYIDEVFEEIMGLLHRRNFIGEMTASAEL